MPRLIIRNAAGTAKTLEDVERLCNSAVTDITVGSITSLPRAGNSGTTTGWNEKSRAYANSLGLPNWGIDKYASMLSHMTGLAHRARKELVVSVAGFSPQDYASLVSTCYRSRVDSVEINLGCPNVWGPEGRKPIASHDPDLTQEILRHIAHAVRPFHKKVSVKISPNLDDSLLAALGEVIIESGVVFEVVACNTLPDQDLVLENGSHALSFTTESSAEVQHIGGLSGKPLFADSLRIVGMLRSWMPKNIRIVAAGGIFTGDDAQSYLNAGAQGFSCAAAYMLYGEKIFGDIAAGLSL